MSALLKQFRRIRPKDSSRKAKLAQDLLKFQKCSEHGFPSKPSAIAYDPLLKILAIGTKTGAIKIVGKPGIEFYSHLSSGAAVRELYFLPDQGRLICLSSDNTFHLLEINGQQVDDVKQFQLPGSEEDKKAVSVCGLSRDAKTLYIGTEGGNVHVLDTESFTAKDHVIYHDSVMEIVSDEHRSNPGAVEAIKMHPTDDDKFLIGYNKGMLVLYNGAESRAEHAYNASQQLESVAWHRDGSQFMSSHNDGSYIIWSVSDPTGNYSTKPKDRTTTPYGPFPCVAINKIAWKTSSKGEPFIIFSGGMPRASYIDRNAVTVMQDSNHVVFEFTSKVIDFIIIDEEEASHDNPNTLVVLAEEEIVVLDLVTEKWPVFRLPYLNSMHTSPITCCELVSNVPDTLWNKIKDAGAQQMTDFSPREWPINGGVSKNDEPQFKDLLLTGHEDGSIYFWDASTPAISLLYKLSTTNIFVSEGASPDQAGDGDEDWPPFRKVSSFDPWSDDPKFAIQRICMCPISETIVVGGSAGQVIVFNIEREQRVVEVTTVSSSIVNDRDNFVWKGHEALEVKTGDNTFPAGYQPSCVLQLQPPAACTALAFHPEWQLLAAGTGHGFTVFDYARKKEVASTCTLNPQELTAAESSMSRGKKFKKSLRESIRRLRTRKAARAAAADKKDESPKKSSPKKTAESSSEAKAESTEEKKEETEEKKDEAKEESPAAEGGETSAAEPSTSTAAEVKESPKKEIPTPTEHKPVERKIEARAEDDSLNSVIRSLHFTETFVIDGQAHTPSIWAGTNGGVIYVFKLTLPASDKRDSEDITCTLCKEIKLRHRAPVIGIAVLDKTGCPLPEPFEVEHQRVKAADMTGGHQLLVCSEEQFKIFALPHLKAKIKEKITAVDGSKLKRVGFINIRSKNDDEYSSYGIASISNQGEVTLYSLPQLSLQSKNSCMKSENIIGINSCVFDKYGQGINCSSASEFEHFALTTWRAVKADCHLDLKEGMRPEKVEEPTPEPEAETVVENAVENESNKQEETVENGDTESEEKKEEVDTITDSLEKSNLDDSKANEHDEPATDITIDSVKEYMMTSEDTVIVEKSITHKKVVEVNESKTIIDGEVTVNKTSTTVEETTVNGSAD